MPPKIYNVKEPLDLDRLHLAKPTNKNGSHFIKTLDVDNPIYFLGPKCFTKSGFVKSGKKMFCDFVFSNEDSDFLTWLDNLEEKSRGIIYNNRETWFETTLDEHDIENSMSSPYKPYKSGKYFIVRANVPTTLEKINIKIYDENENETDPENVKENTKVLSVFEFQGIRCSVRSFQFEIELKQLLILEPEKLFEKCIIAKNPFATITAQQSSLGFLSEAEGENTNKTRNADDGRSLTEMNGPAILSKGKDDAMSFAFTKESENDPVDIQNTTEDVDVDLESSASIIPLHNFSFKPPHKQIEDSRQGAVMSEESAIDCAFTSYAMRNGVKPQNDLHHDEVNDIVSNSEETPIEIIDVDFPLEDITDSQSNKEPPLRLKSRNDVYYKLYKETRQKAKAAKREALANYLEAKRIKNTYLLEDLSESESDEDDDYLEDS